MVTELSSGCCVPSGERGAQGLQRLTTSEEGVGERRSVAAVAGPQQQLDNEEPGAPVSRTSFLRRSSQVSPFALPSGGGGDALPPASVTDEDVELLASSCIARRALNHQMTMVDPPSAGEVARAAAAASAPAATAPTAAPAPQGVQCGTMVVAGVHDCRSSSGPSALEQPEALCSSSSHKVRLPSCCTSLVVLASMGALAASNIIQGAPQPCAVPPHGVKAVCGLRAKMEDTFSVQCNFADFQLSSADASDCGNKLPARIASQVGEQLEVTPATQQQQQHSSSPPTSTTPPSPNSTCMPSLCNSDHEPSMGGSATCSSDVSDGNSCASGCCDTLHFFAVYDGHGGVEAAQHCATRLHFHLSAALSAIAGPSTTTTLHSQDATCMTNRAPGAPPYTTTTTTTMVHEADWTLCPSPMAGPERCTDSLAAPPPGMLADLSRGPTDQHEASSSSRAQQAVDRLFRSSDGVVADNSAALLPPPLGATSPGAVPAGASEITGGAGAGEAASSNSDGDGDIASHTSGGDVTRSESAGAMCMTEVLEAALRTAFLRTDEEFAEDDSSAMVGSTAVVALVASKRLWIANCGDSRAVLCRGGRAIQVTDDHKPEREDEAARVEKAGGQVLYWNGHRVMGVLAMSRAIGDHGLRPYVIPEPEITVLSRVAGDDFLLLASDGLWDVMSNQEAIMLALRCLLRSRDKGASRKAAVRVAATVLTRAAMDRGSKDNVTVVIIDLKAPDCSDASGLAEPSSCSAEGVTGTSCCADGPTPVVTTCGRKVHPLAAALQQETILRGSAAAVEAAKATTGGCKDGVESAVGAGAHEGSPQQADETMQLGSGGGALLQAMALARVTMAASEADLRPGEGQGCVY